MDLDHRHIYWCFLSSQTKLAVFLNFVVLCRILPTTIKKNRVFNYNKIGIYHSINFTGEDHLRRPISVTDLEFPQPSQKMQEIKRL